MTRKIDRLYVRTDWGLVRLLYVPAIFVVVAAIMFIPALAAVKLRISVGCGLCLVLKHWGHRSEEWFNAKPLLAITNEGLAHEDGGHKIIYRFTDIDGIAIQRRKAPWLTDGHNIVNPSVWLTLRIRNPQATELPKGLFKSKPPEHLFIDVWPREIEGGLMRLRRFAKALERNVRADPTAIPK